MLVAGVINVGLGSFFLFKSDSTMGIASLTAGLVLLLAATIDRFETLKGLGLEAKTRQLTHTIAEAQATLIQLRELAELSGEATIQLTSGQGRLGSAPTIEQGYLTSRRVKGMLQKVGSQEEKIRDALRPWAKIVAFDAVWSVVAELRHLLSATERNKIEERNAIAASDPMDPRIEQINKVTEKLTALQQSLHTPNLQIEEPADATKHLREILSGATKVDPMVRAAVAEVIEPWLPRLTYLRDNLDLSDQQAWFSVRH